MTITTSEPRATGVYLNADIVTLDPTRPRAEALAVAGQRLLYVGTAEGALRFADAATEVIDVAGLTILPGLVEGHLHLAGVGTALLSVDAYLRPKADTLAEVAARCSELGEGEWVVGRGWNEEAWQERALPTRAELDAIAPHHPVCLSRSCGHAVWVNSLTLALAGVGTATPDPEGGEIVRDGDGEPTGILVDAAAALVWHVWPETDRQGAGAALLAAQEHLLALGITSVADAGVGATGLGALRALGASGELKLRVYAMVNAGETDAQYKIGPEIGLYDDHLTVRCVKIYADGSLGARSAWLTSEYSDRPGHCGVPLYSDDSLATAVRSACARGFQVAVHAIGDRAVSRVLDVYQQVLESDHRYGDPSHRDPSYCGAPRVDHRFRIEHFQIVSRDDVARAALLGVVPSMQPIHATSDRDMAEARLGQARAADCYDWRRVVDAGMVVVGGSDAPVEPANPFFGMHAAVTRCRRTPDARGAWNPDSCLSAEEALKSFTSWAAYGQLEEDSKGSLVAGKLADFIVVTANPLTCPSAELKDISVLRTVIGGALVWQKA